VCNPKTLYRYNNNKDHDITIHTNEINVLKILKSVAIKDMNIVLYCTNNLIEFLEKPTH
jgi:hypothetical protein